MQFCGTVSITRCAGTDFKQSCVGCCRHLHAVDNYEVRPQRGDPDFDPLWKISGLMADVAAEFRKAFHPGKYICLDESMVKYEGRHSMKIYNPKKPIKVRCVFLVSAGLRSCNLAAA